MLTSKKTHVSILISLMLVWGIVALGGSSEQPKSKVSFEMRDTTQEWLIGTGTSQNGQGSIQPSHVAVLFIGYSQNFPDFS